MAATYFRPVVLLTAILTFTQSIAWFVMSLLGILSYRCDMLLPDDADKSSRLMVFLYFQGPECPVSAPITWLNVTSQIVTTPIYVHGWMCTYLTLDITYFIISISLLIELCRSSNSGEFSLTNIRLWCLNTFAFLVMDLWLTIIWGIDFGKIKTYLDKTEGSEALGWSLSVPGALMAVTARGFILYVINLSLFIYLLRFSFHWGYLCSGRWCQPANQYNSRQQLHKSHTDPDFRSRGSLPRLDQEWDNGQVLVPVGRRATITHSHPNAVEGVTSFNDWYGGHPSRQQKNLWDEDLRQETRSLGRSRPPSPPRRARRDEEIFQGRPSIRTTFEYPDRRNFEQGGARHKPAGARHQELY